MARAKGAAVAPVGGGHRDVAGTSASLTLAVRSASTASGELTKKKDGMRLAYRHRTADLRTP
jgi:hypothetical protein